MSMISKEFKRFLASFKHLPVPVTAPPPLSPRPKILDSPHVRTLPNTSLTATGNTLLAAGRVTVNKEEVLDAVEHYTF